MKRLLLINGPPRSGKDTAGNFFKKHLSNAAVYKISKPLKDAFAGLFQLRGSDLHDMLEEHKDEPQEIMGGASPREIQIFLSESVCKPNFGYDFLGKVAAHAIDNMMARYIIINDIGFDEEIVPLTQKLGGENTFLLYLKRDGCDFSKDSRNYIDAPDIPKANQYNIHNKYDLDLFEEQIKKVIDAWQLHSLSNS